MKNLIRYPARLQVSNHHGKALKTLKKGAYYHLGMDARGSLHLYVNIHLGDSFKRLTFVNSYFLYSLLHALLVRPVRASATPFTWYHQELQNLRNFPIENVAPEFIDGYYQQAQAELLAVCGKDITPDQRRLCNAQIQKITDRQKAISKSILAMDGIACARSVEASL